MAETKKASAATKKKSSAQKEPAQKTEQKKFSISIPSIKDMFAAGVQFGHETRRWNPKMRQYIYDARKNIHIIDVTKTEQKLAEAAQFVANAASQGDIVFVGTKKQAAHIVRDIAVDAGAHFVDMRWAGGILTNFKKVRESFLRLRNLETMFEKGIEGRTKYEISLLKKEWSKLNRLYGGIKTLDTMPKAVVVVDAKYEKGAIREARLMNIPVISLVDTNTNPDHVDYLVPANDDALSSIKLIMGTLGEAVKTGNGGKGVSHHLKDYTKFEVQIIRGDDDVSDNDASEVASDSSKTTQSKSPKPAAKKVKKVTAKKKTAKSTEKGAGLLGNVQKEKEAARAKAKKK